MTFLNLLDALSAQAARLSLLGDESTDGRLHVLGRAKLTASEAEILSRHRELLSTLLVQAYERSGQEEVSAEELVKTLGEFIKWLSRQNRSEVATLASGGTMSDLACAVVQDSGAYRMGYHEILRILNASVDLAA